MAQDGQMSRDFISLELGKKSCMRPHLLVYRHLKEREGIMPIRRVELAINSWLRFIDALQSDNEKVINKKLKLSMRI